MTVPEPERIADAALGVLREHAFSRDGPKSLSVFAVCAEVATRCGCYVPRADVVGALELLLARGSVGRVRISHDNYRWKMSRGS